MFWLRKVDTPIKKLKTYTPKCERSSHKMANLSHIAMNENPNISEILAGRDIGLTRNFSR